LQNTPRCSKRESRGEKNHRKPSQGKVGPRYNVKKSKTRRQRGTKLNLGPISSLLKRYRHKPSLVGGTKKTQMYVELGEAPRKGFVSFFRTKVHRKRQTVKNARWRKQKKGKAFSKWGANKTGKTWRKYVSAPKVDRGKVETGSRHGAMMHTKLETKRQRAYNPSISTFKPGERFRKKKIGKTEVPHDRRGG